ncbi:hypothetical protein EU528_08635 [Candidatus Thorarchaeota archaeon]|nr:MAG: hypothetical protein EU528_08635 [Candidatus Thorarchaeota archaeon]
MTSTIEGLRDSAAEKFEEAKQVLLPNEVPQFICQIEKGFFVITSRRVAILKEESPYGYYLARAIPFDSILDFETKKTDCVVISCAVSNQLGNPPDTKQTFEIKAPQGDRGENKSEVRAHFQSTMNRAKDYISITTQTRDLTYLTSMPESLTRNAILDLNTILRDQPIHEELVYEAMKFLGNEPFLLEESLRDGEDKENGVLFAAGANGYFWIQGKKDGRFMSNVIVNSVEWNNIRCITHQWDHDIPLINITFSLVQGGKETTVNYQWAPPTNDETLQFPWLLQSMNGPYILEDIVYKYTGKLF